MRRVYSFILYILALSCFLLNASDRDIALVYQKQIGQLFVNDKIESAQLLDVAFTYDENLSGLWLFKAQLLEDENELNLAEAAYDRALKLDDWEGSDYDLFLDNYMRLLNRMGLWTKILNVRDKVGFYRVNKRELLLASGWSLFYLKEESRAVEEASRGMDLYPREPRFYTLSLASGGDKNILEGFLHYWGDDWSVLFETVNILVKLDRLPEELNRYYREGSHDYLAAFFLLTKTLTNDKEDNSRRVAKYLEQYEVPDLGLLFQLFDVCSQTGQDKINLYILNHGEGMFFDQQGDSFNELQLSDNKILIDRNRDGQWDTQVSLDSLGVPVLWETHGIENDYRRIDFFQWPFVKEVDRKIRETQQKYLFLYPRFSLDQKEISDEFTYLEGESSLVELIKNSLESDLDIPLELYLNSCYRIEELIDSSRRNYFIHAGDIVGIEEDSNGDGYFDRQIILEKDEVTAARRDLDGNGTFDLFEYYKHGIWQGFAINLNGNTWSDFYQDWSVISLKLWDFDKDRLINGYIIGSREYSDIIIEPQVRDIINVEDLLYWERKFEAQWYR